jgi:hypothetical protein
LSGIERAAVASDRKDARAGPSAALRFGRADNFYRELQNGTQDQLRLSSFSIGKTMGTLVVTFRVWVGTGLGDFLT